LKGDGAVDIAADNGSAAAEAGGNSVRLQQQELAAVAKPMEPAVSLTAEQRRGGSEQPRRSRRAGPSQHQQEHAMQRQAGGALASLPAHASPKAAAGQRSTDPKRARAAAQNGTAAAMADSKSATAESWQRHLAAAAKRPQRIHS
jgi:hypothetical protein